LLLLLVSFEEEIIESHLIVILSLSEVFDAKLSLKLITVRILVCLLSHNVDVIVVVISGIMEVSFKLVTSVELKKTTCLQTSATVRPFLSLGAIIASHSQSHVGRLQAAVSSTLRLL